MSDKGDVGVVGTELVKVGIHTCCNCRVEMLLRPNWNIENLSLSNLPTISQACLFCPFQYFCPEMKRLKTTLGLEDADRLKNILAYLDTQKPFSRAFSDLFSGKSNAHFVIKSVLSNGVWTANSLKEDATIFNKDQKSVPDGK